MSHQDLGAIWSILQGRVDIENILQELVGQYILNNHKHRSDRLLFRASSFTHIAALRTVFDLQRTYLESPQPTLETRAATLLPEVLLSALSHLLEVKASAFRTADGLPDHDEYCSFIGQTQLSGLRALLLGKKKLPPRDYDAFILRFDEVWGPETLRAVDEFSVNHFCRSILIELSEGTREATYSTHACGLFNLRTVLQQFVSTEMPSQIVPC